MKIACIYLCVSTNEQDIARQADIKAKLQSSLIYPKSIRTVNSTHITMAMRSFLLMLVHLFYTINVLNQHFSK